MYNLSPNVNYILAQIQKIDQDFIGYAQDRVTKKFGEFCVIYGIKKKLSTCGRSI